MVIFCNDIIPGSKYTFYVLGAYMSCSWHARLLYTAVVTVAVVASDAWLCNIIQEPTCRSIRLPIVVNISYIFVDCVIVLPP